MIARSTLSAEASPAGQRPTVTRFYVLAWLCAAATIAYVCRNSIAVAESTIRGDLGLTKEQMGVAMSAFFITYALCQIPSGWLVDRIGSRLALPVFATGWSAATALMGAVWSGGGLVAARAANGLAQAGLFPGSTNTIAKWFPGSQRAIANGSLISFMSAGGALGAAATGLLLDVLGWRGVFALYALLGVAWAAGFRFWFRNWPHEHRGVNEGELALIERTRATSRPEAGRAAPTPWMRILLSPSMWCVCGQQFFRVAGYMFFASWFATYLQQTRGVSPRDSGLLTALPLLAVVAGAFSGGCLSDWVLAKTGDRGLARRGVAGSALALCGLLIVAAYFVHNVLGAVALISAGTFLYAFAGPCAYSVSIDMGGRHVATVFSTMNMCGNLGSVAFPVVVPLFLRLSGSWESVLLLFAATFFASSACWWLLNPRRPIV